MYTQHLQCEASNWLNISLIVSAYIPIICNIRLIFLHLILYTDAIAFVYDVISDMSSPKNSINS